MNNYWIKRIEKLKEENSKLKEIMWSEGISCIHFDGKECRHGWNNQSGKDCNFCEEYEVNKNAY